jgi:hypothetical protein
MNLFDILVGNNSKLWSRLMTAMDNFNTALAGLQTNMTAHDAAIQAELAEIKTLLANNNGANDAAIQAAADKVSAISSQIAQETSDLTSSLPPATP